MTEQHHETKEERLMRLRADRLRQARQAFGNGRLKTLADAARYLRVNKATYAQHENGTRGFTQHAANYAKKLGVSTDWLLGNTDDITGGGALVPLPETEFLREEATLARQHADNSVRLAELSVLVMKLEDPHLQKQVIAAIEAILINADVPVRSKPGRS